MMVFKCEHCSYYSDENEEEMVCPSCGIVFQEVNIEEKTEFGERASKKFTSYDRSKKNYRTPQGLSFGLKMIKTLNTIYHVTPEISQKATNMFQEAFALKYYHSVEDNRILAGCCLYIVLRENNLPVLISDLCMQIQCRTHRFNSIYKKIKSSTNIIFEPQQTEDLVESILNGMPEEGKKQLIEKTKSLVTLCQSCWITSGRSPKNLIIASAFLCWKSMNQKCERMSFTKFCSEFRFSLSRSKERVKEIQGLLLKLASNISSPGNCGAHKKNIIFFLDYILNHSESLRNDLLSREHSTDGIDKKEFDSFRKSPRKRCHSKGHHSAEGEFNASDVEISDSEISKYIRTDAEIAAIQKIKEEI